MTRFRRFIYSIYDKNKPKTIEHMLIECFRWNSIRHETTIFNIPRLYRTVTIDQSTNNQSLNQGSDCYSPYMKELETCRFMNRIPVARTLMSSTGLAATLYRNGFTAQTIFGIPIGDSRSDTPVCTISASSQRAELIRSSNEDVINASLKRSDLWREIQVKQLTFPQQFSNNLKFSYFLDLIGNGFTFVNSKAYLPGLNQIYSLEDTIKYRFPNASDINSCSDTSILRGTNAEADLINKVVLNMFSGECAMLS
ncbi:hypothetical protein BB560_006626 [Smittium megazygosporum]|uniref:Uncharacterized protein n=1 Tax=Smittium megazygosporum TaxID=133381 RepID=A0A2T9Y2W6_9FUNG|nr:hypothetical protein BB560_006626 [Smittium megazygosporum]